MFTFHMTPEFAYTIYYVTEKEKDLPPKIRKYLDQISFLVRKKSLSPALAIHLIANKNMNGNKSIDEVKDVLWKLYRKRRAYITNGKRQYQLLQKENKKEIKYCDCGCGKVVKKKNKFINGHNIKGRSVEQNEHLAEIMRIAKLQKLST
jgi:hypothetical protein